MPKVVKMYESDRRGLEHNMGGFFGKPKKKKQEQIPGTEFKGKIKDVGIETKTAIEKRNEALQSVMKEPAVAPTPKTKSESIPVPKPKLDISNRSATLAMRKRREAFEKAEAEKKKKLGSATK